MAGSITAAEKQLLNTNPSAGIVTPNGKVTSEGALSDPAPITPAQILSKQTASSNTPDATNNKPLPNKLKEYPSYIYGLSLHLLSDADYNDTVQSQTYTPKNVLVASAGRWNASTFPRNKFFTEDFYFEDLNLSTVIAPNDNSRNTNAIEGSFTLVEPYGFTFVERLLLAAKDIKSQNYLDMPYLLQIDFYAIDDAGTILGSVEELRKRIPIKITTMDIRVTVKGAEYKIGIVPFNHSAYDSSTCSTPANFEILARTVSEFFQSTEGSSADTVTALNEVHSRVAQENTAGTNTTPTKSAAPSKVKPTASTTSQPKTDPKGVDPKAAPTYNKVKSYGTAINAWTEALQLYNKISAQDTYRFEFPTVTLDDGTSISIGDSPFTDQLKHTPKETQMKGNHTPNDVAAMKKADLGQTSKDASSSAAATETAKINAQYTQYQINLANDLTSGKINRAQFQSEFEKLLAQQNAALAKIPAPSPASNMALYDTSQAIFQVQAGTTIEKLLDYIIRNSNYIQDQLIVPEDPDYAAKKEALKDKPLYWYKIVPTIRLQSFDDRRRVWSREITYSVVPYKMYNIRADVGPQGTMLYPVKFYNYIYTGQNDDVLDFDIKFNALYYNQVTAYRGSLAELNPTAQSALTENQIQNYPNYNGGGATSTSTKVSSEYDSVMPLTMKPIVQISKSNATGGASTAKETAAVDLEASIMTNSSADMLNVKLKILGDPDYIKQDDVFYRPPLEGTNVALTPSVDPRLLPNNSSLKMDAGGLYVQLLFRVPTDIDESTGFMKFEGSYKHSVFSGLYLIQKITNNFAHGQFIQELDMVRMPRQSAYDYVNNQSTNSSDARSETSKQTQPGIQPPAPVPSMLVSNPNSVSNAADSNANQTAGQEQPIAQAQDNPAPIAPPDQQALMAVNDTAPEAVITDQTQPQAVVPDFTPISIRGNQVPGAVAITG